MFFTEIPLHTEDIGSPIAHRNLNLLSSNPSPHCLFINHWVRDSLYRADREIYTIMFFGINYASFDNYSKLLLVFTQETDGLHNLIIFYLQIIMIVIVINYGNKKVSP
jgi:hypothetical protein